MASIYLNNKDREILTIIKNKLENREEINCIDKILSVNEKRRIKSNNVAKVYKKKNRAKNKNFARSKKEIKCNL